MITPKQRYESRYEAHLNNDTDVWERFRSFRNELKRSIRTAKLKFYRTALSSKTPKDIWKVINSVPHPHPRRIQTKPTPSTITFQQLPKER